MDDELHHIQRTMEEMVKQLSTIVKDVGDIKREENAILKLSTRSNIGGHSIPNNQRGYGNFSPYPKSYEHNSYDFYQGNRLGDRNGFMDNYYEIV